MYRLIALAIIVLFSTLSCTQPTDSNKWLEVVGEGCGIDGITVTVASKDLRQFQACITWAPDGEEKEICRKNFGYQHPLLISGLSPQTTYFYTVTATDQDGNKEVVGDQLSTCN